MSPLSSGGAIQDRVDVFSAKGEILLTKTWPGKDISQGKGSKYPSSVICFTTLQTAVATPPPLHYLYSTYLSAAILTITPDFILHLSDLSDLFAIHSLSIIK